MSLRFELPSFTKTKTAPSNLLDLDNSNASYLQEQQQRHLDHQSRIFSPTKSILHLEEELGISTSQLCAQRQCPEFLAANIVKMVQKHYVTYNQVSRSFSCRDLPIS